MASSLGPTHGVRVKLAVGKSVPTIVPSLRSIVQGVVVTYNQPYNGTRKRICCARDSRVPFYSTACRGDLEGLWLARCGFVTFRPPAVPRTPLGMF